MRPEFVTRRVFARKRWCLWLVWRRDGRDVRRALVDLETGEILDEVRLDSDGRVRSWGRADPSSELSPRSSASRHDGSTGGVPGGSAEAEVKRGVTSLPPLAA